MPYCPKRRRSRLGRPILSFRDNPKGTNHPSVRFKCVQSCKGVYFTCVNRDYRALGVLKGDVIIWFWIGSHAEYARLME
ncbi:MAG: hypothetical protein BWY09_01331 [Candidatus Hydrogenedentes bacterium ADurb.Bin179]|nr:MAG: hypothetical protein BWY09_01331 [Candidatus Hydrogenedentes bacterium ADurb.Bin179]